MKRRKLLIGNIDVYSGQWGDLEWEYRRPSLLAFSIFRPFVDSKTANSEGKQPYLYFSFRLERVVLVFTDEIF
jgi:hypothetical protein